MRLGVLIPAFNDRGDLDRTLASLARDPQPFDVLIVDDGSVPPLQVPVATGAHQITTLRMDTNSGIARALNAGIAWMLARGYDLVARLDAGDLNMPERLSRQAQFLTQHPEVVLVGGWTRHVDEQMRPLYLTRYPEQWEAIRKRLHYRTAFSHGACMVRLSALRMAGAYREDAPLGEDYELFWRLALRFPCANLPEVVVTRVEASRSLTHANRLAMAWSRLRLQRQYFTWRRLDCWLGIGRSIALLAVPVWLRLTMKRLAGTVS